MGDYITSQIAANVNSQTYSSKSTMFWSFQRSLEPTPKGNSCGVELNTLRQLIIFAKCAKQEVSTLANCEPHTQTQRKNVRANCDLLQRIV
jgi:hypothetical protein